MYERWEHSSKDTKPIDWRQILLCILFGFLSLITDHIFGLKQSVTQKSTIKSQFTGWVVGGMPYKKIKIISDQLFFIFTWSYTLPRDFINVHSLVIAENYVHRWRYKFKSDFFYILFSDANILFSERDWGDGGTGKDRKSTQRWRKSKTIIKGDKYVCRITDTKMWPDAITTKSQSPASNSALPFSSPPSISTSPSFSLSTIQHIVPHFSPFLKSLHWNSRQKRGWGGLWGLVGPSGMFSIGNMDSSTGNGTSWKPEKRVCLSLR